MSGKQESSNSHRRQFEIIEGGGGVFPESPETDEELEALALRLHATRLGVDALYDHENPEALGHYTFQLRRAFIIMERLAERSGHDKLPDIAHEFAIESALNSGEEDRRLAYATNSTANFRALALLKEAMSEVQSQYIADHPQEAWKNQELKDLIFDGVGQCSAILRQLLPQQTGEETSAYRRRVTDYLTDAIMSSFDDRLRTEDLELVHQARELEHSIYSLHELYRPIDQGDKPMFLLYAGLSIVEGLARDFRHSPEEHAISKVRGMGVDAAIRKTESILMADALELLQIAYAGFEKTDDFEENVRARQEFITHYCPSRFFAQSQNEEVLRKALAQSYETLKTIAGPNTTSGPQLMAVINRVKDVLLRQGAEVKDPDSQEANNLRLLAWQDFPDPETEA